MLSIGQFSRACHVSVKALRHYEKVGLLLPTRVDDWTGYRYDDAGLISTMQLIQRMKRYGFSLADARRIIANPAAGPEALRRQHMSVEDYGSVIGALYEEAARQHITPPSPPMSIYRGEAFDPEDTDMELPGSPMAVTTHQGFYAYGAMTQRLAGQNLKSNGAPYGIYLSGSGQGDPAECRTEIRFPIRMRDAP